MRFQAFYDKLSNWLNPEAIKSLLIFYAFALLFILLPSFLIYGRERFLSDFMSWSFTFLVPNIYMYTLVKYGQKGDFRSVLFRMHISWIAAIGFFGFYLAFNLSQAFQRSVTLNIKPIFISVALANFLMCYSLSKPLTKDLMEKRFQKEMEQADEMRKDVSRMRDQLKVEGPNEN